MKVFLVAYAAALLAFLVIDGIWLGVVARQFYATELGDLLKRNILALPAAVFYLGYTAGLVYLAVRPGEPDISLLNVALTGALVGLMAYGTYDMTNLATVRDWPVLMSVVDMIWGAVLSGAVALTAAIVVRKFM